jgi:hypothetical protein
MRFTRLNCAFPLRVGVLPAARGLNLSRLAALLARSSSISNRRRFSPNRSSCGSGGSEPGRGLMFRPAFARNALQIRCRNPSTQRDLGDRRGDVGHEVPVLIGGVWLTKSRRPQRPVRHHSRRLQNCSIACGRRFARGTTAGAPRPRTWPGFAGSLCFTANAIRESSGGPLSLRGRPRPAIGVDGRDNPLSASGACARVLSRQEVSLLLSRLRGPVWLMASLMYGGGLRLLECAELRVKDIGFDRGELRIRDGKGRKDRVTVLAASLKER